MTAFKPTGGIFRLHWAENIFKLKSITAARSKYKNIQKQELKLYKLFSELDIG